MSACPSKFPIVHCFHLHVAGGAEEPLAEPDGEPVDNLDAGDEAEAEEEAEEAADLRDEVYGGHPEGALELENCRLLGNRLGGKLDQVTDTNLYNFHYNLALDNIKA